MLVNRSVKTSLDKNLQLMIMTAAAIGALGASSATAQVPATPDTPVTTTAPATSSAPATSTAPATPDAPTTTVIPAQVAPPSAEPGVSSSNAPSKATGRDGKRSINAYNGSSASTLNLPNVNPATIKPALPPDPWKLVSLVEKNPSYTVEVKYPQFDPIKGSDPSKLNEEIKRYVMAQVDAARSVMPSKMVHIEGPKPLSYIKGQCNISLYNEHLCSMTVDLTNYAFQSAHPVEALTTFNYRLDKNKQFALNEVFKPQYKFVQALSKMCIASLSLGLDEEGTDWVRRGAAPEEKNFLKFQITKSELLIIFDPYTVDNGSDGFRTVPIVWDRVRSDLSMDLPFHKLVAR